MVACGSAESFHAIERAQPLGTFSGKYQQTWKPAWCTIKDSRFAIAVQFGVGLLRPAMFEVTADDIVLLSDSDLRELVGKLCEAEGNRCGLSTRYVTWGGHQDASDGGLDVRVEFPIGTVTNGFVPRPVTGFQVKKSDMPRSKIVAEMKPDGSVRSVIRELAEKDGAYIIVAAAGSASDSALQNRRNAMAQAVAEL